MVDLVFLSIFPTAQIYVNNIFSFYITSTMNVNFLYQYNRIELINFKMD